MPIKKRLLTLGLSFLLAAASNAQSANCPYIFMSSFETNENGQSTICTTPISDAEAAHFLTQATFGPTYASINAVKKLGYEGWLAQQAKTTASMTLSAIDAEIEALEAAGKRIEVISSEDVRASWFHNVLNNPDQLRQRVAHALSQIFVISSDGTTLRASALAVYYDMLVDESLGNYRDLLEKVTLSPAMGSYLSMLKNRKKGLGTADTVREDLRDDARPDENYAREIMQLFSVGLVMLNQDGSIQKGKDGKPIPTYMQETIQGFARAFTGWHFGSLKPPVANPHYKVSGAQPPFVYWHWHYLKETDGDNGRVHDLKAQRWRLPMKPWGEGSEFGDVYHETGEKQLLNYPGVALKDGILPAGRTAREDLTAALDNLFNHPNVPPFIAFRLIQRLTTSNPSPEYIKRVADVFTDNGNGVRGDLNATVKAILLDPEARDASKAPKNFGKVREPIIRVANVYRALKGRHKTGNFREHGLASVTQQMMLDSPTVFNYFLPLYQHAGLAIYSPELQMMTDAQVLSLTDFLENKLYLKSHLGELKSGIDYAVQLDFSELVKDIDRPEALVGHIDLLFTYGKMSQKQKERYITMLNNPKYANHGDDPKKQIKRIANVIALVLSSPDYIVETH